MQNHKINFFIFTNWLIKSSCVIALTGMSTLIGLPMFSQDRYRTVENNLVATLKETGRFENLV